MIEILVMPEMSPSPSCWTSIPMLPIFIYLQRIYYHLIRKKSRRLKLPSPLSLSRFLCILYIYPAPVPSMFATALGFPFKRGGKGMGANGAEAFMRSDDLQRGLGLSSPSPESVEFLNGELENLILEEEEEDGVEKGSSVPPSMEEEWEKGQRYPQRPGEPNCAYYMKTGCCGYGADCKFNHPPARWNQQASSWDQLESSQAVKERAYIGLPETMGLPECKFYLMPGGCKYGKACRYGHYHEKTDVESVELNFVGLPIRPGERECPYYMRTGSCRYSTNCWFHHPDPTAEVAEDSFLSWQNGGYPKHISEVVHLPATSLPLQRNSNEPVSCLNDSSPSFVQGFFLPHQVVRSNPEYNHSQAPESLTTPPDRSMLIPSASTFNYPSTKTSDPVNLVAEVEEYPERPGEPECQFFMKFGDCKFKAACRFHHPKTRLSKQSNCPLTPLGLPLRPDQPICTFYSRFGICKYGPACKFDHSMDSVSST